MAGEAAQERSECLHWGDGRKLGRIPGESPEFRFRWFLGNEQGSVHTEVSQILCLEIWNVLKRGQLWLASSIGNLEVDVLLQWGSELGVSWLLGSTRGTERNVPTVAKKLYFKQGTSTGQSVLQKGNSQHDWRCLRATLSFRASLQALKRRKSLVAKECSIANNLHFDWFILSYNIFLFLSYICPVMHKDKMRK